MKETEQVENQCNGRTKKNGDCWRRGTIVRGGVSYCWHHDPVRLEAKAKEDRLAASQLLSQRVAEEDARIARRDLETAAGTLNLSNDELREIALLGGVMAIVARVKESGQ